MLQETKRSRTAADDYVEFWAAGDAVKGEFHCSECRYGVTIVRALPVCPMCGGTAWEQTAWHPFTHNAI
jgi:rubrerythrin